MRASRKVMRASRRKQEQMSLLDATGTRPASKRGGRRKGAGRKPRGSRARASHAKRPALAATTPVHITLRVLAVMGVLRRRSMWSALRWATIALASKRDDCRIVQFSVQRDHIHLVVEAQHAKALSDGMRAFQISAARRMNAKLGRTGQVFADRYHAEYLTSPRQVRNALAYVMNNWRKHREDNGAASEWKHDWYSSSWTFFGWKEREGEHFLPLPPEGYESAMVWLPKTWLLREGWRKHGLISLHEVPGARARAR